jgi:hypothetical protein
MRKDSVHAKFTDFEISRKLKPATPLQSSILARLICCLMIGILTLFLPIIAKNLVFPFLKMFKNF